MSTDSKPTDPSVTQQLAELLDLDENIIKATGMSEKSLTKFYNRAALNATISGGGWLAIAFGVVAEVPPIIHAMMAEPAYVHAPDPAGDTAWMILAFTALSAFVGGIFAQAATNFNVHYPPNARVILRNRASEVMMAQRAAEFNRTNNPTL